jgi:hypothetical protein
MNEAGTPAPPPREAPAAAVAAADDDQAQLDDVKMKTDGRSAIMKQFWSRRWCVAVAMAGALVAGGCASGTNSGSSATPVAQTPEAQSPAPDQAPLAGVPQQGQMLFQSPEEAAGTFKDAVLAKDRRTLVAIFGMDGKTLIFSGDPIQENNDLDRFGKHLSEYAHVDWVSDEKAVLYVGQENWPFPIPIIKSDGGWFFDTVAGKDELLDRRIGADELNAINVCRAFVQAEREYASRDWMGDGHLQYAQHFISHPGTKDGLYWQVGPGEDLSPLGPLVAEAQMDDYPATRPTTGGPQPYKGYIFRILKAQGDAAPGGQIDYIADGRMIHGFAMVAGPAEYGASGIMTFIVGKDGVVYQKDLGADSTAVVKAMTEFNPDSTWTVVKD